MSQSNGESGERVTVELTFYAPFRDATDRKTVEQTHPRGASVGDALARAVETYPDLDGKLLDDAGRIPDGVRILRNGRARAEADARLEDGDELSFTTPIHGG